MDAELKEKIDKYLLYLHDMVKAYYREHCTNLVPPEFEIEEGEKWARVVKFDSSSRSAYAFIALVSNYTRQLGQVNLGDIHRPDGWKKPAKHKRGNVMVEDYGSSGPHGLGYLK